MPSFAKIYLMGHLGNNPELQTVGKNATPMVRLSLAVNIGWGDNKETSWYKIKCWGKTAEFVASNMAKGEPVFVEGEPTISEWEDKNGNKRTSVDVFCMKIIKLRWEQKAADLYANDTPAAPAPAAEPDDLPF